MVIKVPYIVCLSALAAWLEKRIVHDLVDRGPLHV